MKAIVQKRYGSADVFELEEIEMPVVKDDTVLVRVRAAALHAGDVFTMRGKPYLVRVVSGWPRPRTYVPGFDVAGQVESVGKDVKRFRAGDDVFGTPGRTCAEYAAGAEAMFVPKPAGLSFEEAAAVPTSGLAALQGLRDVAKVQPGQKVLVNGASGGVGIFAVQVAKALGAEVTGVCSTGNVEMVQMIGADHVVDYTREDFTQTGERYDLIFDNVGNRSFADCRRALTPTGMLQPNTGNAGMGYVLKAYARSVFNHQQGRPFLSTPKQPDLIALKELIEAGKVRAVIDRTYTLSETVDALRYLDAGHARGKVVITI